MILMTMSGELATQAFTLATQHAEAPVRAVASLAQAMGHAAPYAAQPNLAEHGQNLIVLAQNAAPANDAASYAERVKEVSKEQHLGWLTLIGTHFIGIFQKGGEVADVVAITVAQEDPTDVCRFDDRERVCEPLFPVDGTPGVDDHRLSGGDDHRVDGYEAVGSCSFNLGDHPGLGCDEVRGLETR